jgi:hypothetical protein
MRQARLFGLSEHPKPLSAHVIVADWFVSADQPGQRPVNPQRQRQGKAIAQGALLFLEHLRMQRIAGGIASGH